MWGWPEPFIYAVYDRKCEKLPANNAISAPCIHGPGQP